MPGFTDDDPTWDSLLRVCSAHEAYIQRYQERVEPEGVVDVLVLAADFPRLGPVSRGPMPRIAAPDRRRSGRQRRHGGGAPARPARRRLALHRRRRSRAAVEPTRSLVGVLDKLSRAGGGNPGRILPHLNGGARYMLLRIDHETRLTYSEPVTESVIKLRMAPRSGDDQTLMSYRLTTHTAGAGHQLPRRIRQPRRLFNILPPHSEVW